MTITPAKTCPKCKGLYPTVDGFYKSRNTASGLDGWCKLCRKVAGKTRLRQNTEKVQLQGRRNNLKRDFGITLDQYDKMFDAQGGVCAICSGIETGGRHLAVDHDHKTGKVRGLLCSKCNVALGSLKDSPELFIKALHYLIKKGANYEL